MKHQKIYTFPINVGPFNKAVGPGKNPELINIGPDLIRESRVCFVMFQRYILVT
jgi:hypothetical protein